MQNENTGYTPERVQQFENVREAWQRFCQETEEQGAIAFDGLKTLVDEIAPVLLKRPCSVADAPEVTEWCENYFRANPDGPPA